MDAIYNSVTAFGPGSIGNLTVGFDVVGMCLQSPGDLVTISTETDRTYISEIIGDSGRLPLAISENTAGIAVLAYLRAINSHQHVSIRLVKQMPLGSGMGSSGASAVAAVLAVNHLFGSPMSKHELTQFVLEAEGASSGSVHGDNVLPSLLGGIILINSYEPLSYRKLPIPSFLHYGLIHPHLEIKTAEARSILPSSITRQAAIRQMGLLAGFTSALYESDRQGLSEYLHDVIAEPVRASLMPYLSGCRTTAMELNAIHCGISGSGPSLFTLWDTIEAAEQGSKALATELAKQNIGSEYYFGAVNQQGAYIVEAR